MARFTACEHCGELLMENGRNWIHGDGFFTCLAAPGHYAEPIPAPTEPQVDALDRTAKMYIGGKQARPDSGYSQPVYGPKGKLLGHIGIGNRKDIRNAVEAAHALRIDDQFLRCAAELHAADAVHTDVQFFPRDAFRGRRPNAIELKFLERLDGDFKLDSLSGREIYVSFRAERQLAILNDPFQMSL